MNGITINHDALREIERRREFQKDLEKFKKDWENYFNDWRANDGGLTWAASDGLRFLYWACKNIEDAIDLYNDFEAFMRLDSWEQQILSDLIHNVIKKHLEK